MNIYVCSPDFSADALKLLGGRHHVDVRTAPELPDERELCELIKKVRCLGCYSENKSFQSRL